VFNTRLVRPSVPYGLVSRKQKNVKKIKIVNWYRRSPGHELKMSKVKVKTLNWRHVYLRAADQRQADPEPSAN